MRPFSLMHMHRKPQIFIGYRAGDSIYLQLAIIIVDILLIIIMC